MSKRITYTISPNILERFPEYRRGLVIARNVHNGPASPELVALLRAAEASVAARTSLDGIAEDPSFRPWRDAFRWFGAKPSEFRSSVEALARRALRGQPLPTITSLVDIGTTMCLRHLVPIGGHALDDVNGDLELRPALGSEVFVPFGSDQAEHPLQGEIIFAEGDTVLTRRWVWRQANHTLVVPETRRIVFNIDVLRKVDEQEVVAYCDDLAELVSRYCGGETECQVLSVEQPELSILL
jgi:DNA/RNA-binding domain of Phe-tRNA-synthetase-like protein